MKLSDFFKLIEDKHMPEDQIIMRDCKTGEIVAGMKNVGTACDDVEKARKGKPWRVTT